MELRQQRYFIAVAEELHFSRAAAKLKISQPALSKQIRELETELGVPLFWRSKREVRLTPAGTSFLKHAREVRSQVERSVQEARSIDRGDFGTIEVGFFSSAGARLVPQLVRRFRKRYPRVEVRLRGIIPPAAQEMLRSPQVDFGVLTGQSSMDGLVTEPLLEERYMVAMPDDHPLSRWTRVPLRSLNGVPFIFFPRHVGPEVFDDVMGFLRMAKVTPKTVLEAFPAYAILSAVAAGIGTALLPESMEDLSLKGVVYRRLLPPAPTIKWVLAYKHGRIGGAQAAFLEVARELYGKKP